MIGWFHLLMSLIISKMAEHNEVELRNLSSKIELDSNEQSPAANKTKYS